MPTNLAGAQARRIPDFRIGAAAALLALATFLSGCAGTAVSAPPSAHRAILTLRHEAPARVENAALAYARLHEGDFTLTGAGESMAPVYSPGTVVVVHPTSFFMLRAGMAVVYVNRAGRQVAHVLIEERGAGWIAQGLNNAEPDCELVTPENLVGVVACAFVPEADENRSSGALLAASFPTAPTRFFADMAPPRRAGGL
jgi:hypothetical protein